MSRYDRERERKRFLIIAGVIAVFFAAVFFWGLSVSNATNDRLAQEVGR